LKPHLDPDEVLRAAVAHLIDGVEQQVIAGLLGTNIGRINEVCTAMDFARHNVKDVYRLALKKREGE